jgi:uridine kinase
MIGDKLIIEPYHTARAEEIYRLTADRIRPGFTISVAGESGAGKSELAVELARILKESGIPAGVLQQDDYFVFPPKTNHEMRRRNIEQVGPYEVKLDYLDSNLRSFKRGETPIYKPLVLFDQDRITTEEMNLENKQVVIVEGTYTSLLKFLDIRVFIDRDYHQTLEARKRRGRDKFEPFVLDVLEREHNIIREHKSSANIIIPPDFDSIQVFED